MILEPLNIKCTATQCDDGLHCYRQKRRKAGRVSGPCRTCGVELVDWHRIHQRDLSDVANTFATMKTELVRHEYWHVDIDDEALNHARRKGRLKLQIDIDKRLRSSLAPAKDKLYRDGMQTPRKGRVIYYAQHATATCCRTCLEEWHGVPQDRDMTEEEIAYCTELIRLYIAERLPMLTDEGEKIPPRRRVDATENTQQVPHPMTEQQKIRAALEAKRKRRNDHVEN